MGSLAGDQLEREEKGSDRNGGVPDLLEEAWFFRKLIDGSSGRNNKPASGKFMGRCFSDPTSSQSVVPPAPPKGEGGGLVRAPSLPPGIGRRGDGDYAAEGRKSGGKRNNGKSLKTGDMTVSSKKGGKIKPSGGGGRNPGSLARAPSLPPWIGREEEEESDGEESGMSMSRLIQQAMSSSLDDISTLTKHSVSSPKSMIRSSRSMRNEVRGDGERRRPNPEARDDQRVISRQSGVISTTNHNNNPPPSPCNPKGIRKLTKTMSNLEIHQDQASYYESKKAAMRPQRPSYDHLLRCGGPPIPTWAPGPTSNAKGTTAPATSSAEDIKAHLKVWARTVAANIH
ncbi:unnamed protein product [Linum tenue]|uniref:Uncharacterized protein n=1 Tax=Linum tenue TaxID=586396 RepID=A0AAV0JJP2_9ROSI|nr:unnamed protein product [Linum tenue]